MESEFEAHIKILKGNKVRKPFKSIKTGNDDIVYRAFATFAVDDFPKL